MLEYFSEPGGDVYIRCQLASTDTGLYPQTKIYDITAPTTVYATVNLTELSNGLYGEKWTTPSSSGKYFTQTIIYTNSGHTTESPVDRPDSDSINVGRYQGGGYIGGYGTKLGVARTQLSDDEIKRIVEALMAKIMPEIDRKIDFSVILKALSELDLKTSKTADFNAITELKTYYANSLGETRDALRFLINKNEKRVQGMEDFMKVLEGSVNNIYGEVNKVVKEPQKVEFTGDFGNIRQEMLLNSVLNYLAFGKYDMAFKLSKELSAKDKEQLIEIVMTNPEYQKAFNSLVKLDTIGSLFEGKTAKEKEVTLKKLLDEGVINQNNYKKVIKYVRKK